MAEIEDEVVTLHQEFDWLLQEEVTVILEEIHDIILECARRFPDSDELYGVESLVKSEKFLLTNTSSTGGSTTDTIQAIVTLSGDNISYADVLLKLHKHSVPSHRTIVQNDCQWKLQQIQDAGNHLALALQIFSSLPAANMDGKLEFQSAEEVIHAESSVPWLSEVLVLFTVSLQLCQQLKNKVAVFAQYKEMNVT
ncbi:protein rogdi isoform X2 [Parasteatoda tepidariorum]|uniref:protein rogdi isoform X2 n=1 Tax=Parasteatoda tepidariorum TaxID=114398 RepID=UPI001C721BB2|nr:protein rogdi homolog isoform X2 [Parasteatoda tepidariorum]